MSSTAAAAPAAANAPAAASAAASAAAAPAAQLQPTTSPREARGSEVVDFVRRLLDDRGQRCTYITVKREVLRVYSERSFTRKKKEVQRMLEAYHKRRTPARPAVKSKKRQAADADGAGGGARADASAAAQAAKKKKKKGKNPKLYFYEVSDEPAMQAEGNRFIANEDL
jgi:hypothetical protein